jgi:hypothetical protein
MIGEIVLERGQVEALVLFLQKSLVVDTVDRIGANGRSLFDRAALQHACDGLEIAVNMLRNADARDSANALIMARWLERVKRDLNDEKYR